MAFICESLSLGNELGVEGAKVIAHALESNRTLTMLYLQCTEYGVYWQQR
jgi:hypothetical protein